MITLLEQIAVGVSRRDTPQLVEVNIGGSNALDTGTPQLDKGRAWVREYPDLKGLSYRKAAIEAGVSLRTLQRAIEAEQHG